VLARPRISLCERAQFLGVAQRLVLAERFPRRRSAD
jgi:hypothetical protein